MDDYLLPLKAVKDKVHGLTGISWNSYDAEYQFSQSENLEPKHVQASPLWKRCRDVGLLLEKVKFIKPLLGEDEQFRQMKDPVAGYDKENSTEKTQPRTSCDLSTILELFQAVVKGELHNGMLVKGATNLHGLGDREKFDENLTLAIRKVLETEEKVEKVLVVSWDSKQSLSIAQAFYEEPRVLCFSLQKESTPSIPSVSNVGEKWGQGYNFNVPYGLEELNDADYLAVLHHLLLPVAHEYNPDLVVINGVTESLSSKISAHLVASLMSLAHGKVVTIVEDGSHLGISSETAFTTLCSLTGRPFLNSLTGGRASERVHKAIVDAINAQRPFWKCLRFQGMDATPENYEGISAEDKTVFIPAKDASSRLARNRVAFIYDDRMLNHYSYTAVNHVERPERMTSIYHRMVDYGLIDRLRRVEAQMASKDQICMLHEPSYIDLLARVKSDQELRPYVFNKEIDSVSFCPDTYELSFLAAGSAIQLVDTILDGDTDSGIAVIRPPGHHAEPGAACGFCVFNNTALAAKHAIEQRNLSRVLIVDWDVHHGNGIQRMFLEDPRVLYISLHAFNDFPVLPEFTNSSVIGKGPGTGFNINIPWSEHGMGDPEYFSAFFNIVLPVAYEFQPELVLVACGFDAARGDPLGKCNVSPETYGHMASLLKPLANGRVGVILEGGYYLESVSYGMTMVAKALLGDPLPRLRLTTIPQCSAREDIRQVKKMLQPYWQCLQFPVPVSASVTKLEETGKPGTLNWCPHLDVLMPLDMSPGKGVGFGRHCQVCWFFATNSCCLTCFKSLCFLDNLNGHSRQHYEETGHALTLHFGNLKVLCHPCQSWVEHPVLAKVYQRAHWERYGEHPSSYPALED